MVRFGSSLVIAALAVGACTHGSAAAQRARYVEMPGYGASSGVPGATVRAAAARAQREPGVTADLAPDSAQTATGGPVGGVPGFSGD